MNSQSHRFIRRFVTVAFLTFPILINPSSNWALSLSETKENGMGAPWALIPAINGGYNKLLKGYEGYDNLGNAGVDVYFRGPRESRLPTEIHHNFLFRFSFDYFPLQLPDGVYNQTEDIFSINTAVIYQFQRLGSTSEAQWVPFVGFGAGMYQDRVTVDTPATGKMVGKHNLFGINASVGMFLPFINFRWPIRLIPEIRYHRLQVPGGRATNMTYQLGLSFWPKREK